MYKNILLPVDIMHPDSTYKAVKIVVEYAEAFGSTIHLMTVISSVGMKMVQHFFTQASMSDITASTKEKLHEFTKTHIPEAISVRHIVASGNVYESIIKVADKKIDCDLIIMAAHRPELKDYLLGPNSARVVRHSKRSVLVVRD